jgi:hypothetical protein
MALEVQFARDAQGKPTAFSSPPIEAVGAFFEREVAPDPGLGDWILEAIDDVLAGRETGAPQVGTQHNHSYVTIDDSCGGFVEVCCDLGESGGPYQDVRKDRLGTFLDCEVPIPDFRAAAQKGVRWANKWQQMTSQAMNGSARLTPPLALE